MFAGNELLLNFKLTSSMVCPASASEKCNMDIQDKKVNFEGFAAAHG